MPATPARIGFITQPYRVATAGPDEAVKQKYGSLARDTTEPLPTFFDSISDTQTICDERHTLLKADRRRFQQAVNGEDFGLSLDYEQVTPTVTVIDDERAANLPASIVDFTVDLENGRTTVITWG